MRIETATRYRCDGCATEQLSPFGWQHMTPINVNQTVALGYTGITPGRDYCNACVEKMRAALPNKSQ